MAYIVEAVGRIETKRPKGQLIQACIVSAPGKTRINAYVLAQNTRAHEFKCPDEAQAAINSLRLPEGHMFKFIVKEVS